VRAAGQGKGTIANQRSFPQYPGSTHIAGDIQDLLANNRRWSQKRTADDPEFFSNLANQQAPEFLWIGCSDSRVPANDIVGLMPGELFVHRNVANIVYAADLNCLSVVEYAVDVLQVKHIIVCGHYGCGGVKAALDHRNHGIIDSWLTCIKDVYSRHRSEIEALPTRKEQIDRMCELNVITQVRSLAHTPVIQSAWARGQQVAVHGWVYGLDNGLVKDLNVRVEQFAQVEPWYRYEA
jgi:carbonic anhydrase